MSEQMTEAEARAELAKEYAEEQRQARIEALSAQSGPELIGMPRFSADQTKTCDQCGETTPAQDWHPCGPTYSDNGRQVKMVTMLGCPECEFLD